jgi:Putative adhesin
MPAFDTPGPIAATVAVAGARVRVTASDRTDTVVLVEPVDTARKKDVKVASKTRVGFAGGQLSVKTTTSGDKNGSVAITIGLPAGSSLAAYLAHSSVQADGSLGECELHMASGRVQLDRISALHASIAGGEVTIGHIAERASIDGAAFALRISEVQDTVKLASSRGQIWIGHASADLDLSSGSGGFDIDRADGSVTAKTGNGAIRIGRLTRGQAELLNGSGNIEVGISAGTTAQVDASSERGSVRNSVPPQETPGTSGDKVTIRARTRHGDIIIRRAAWLRPAHASSPAPRLRRPARSVRD